VIFDRCAGIDYSGAETPRSSLNGLRFNTADRVTPPFECPRLRRHWPADEDIYVDFVIEGATGNGSPVWAILVGDVSLRFAPARPSLFSSSMCRA
jgi:hypothetical protein